MTESQIQNSKSGKEILQNLGLTNMQTRVYLSLLNLKTGTVSEIAKISKIARQDVYKILPDLEEIGLLERIIGNPTEYGAISITNGIGILIAKKTQKNSQIFQEAIQFANFFQNRNSKRLREKSDKEDKFILIPKRIALINKLKKSFKKVKKSVDAIIPGKDWSRVFFEFSDDWELLTYRGVEIRIITNKLQISSKLLKEKKFFKNYKNFQIKYLKDNTNIRAGLHDEERLFIATNPNKDALDSPALFTNNSTIIELFETYFNLSWKNATNNYTI